MTDDLKEWTESTEDRTHRYKELLLEAADDIREYGWRKGGATEGNYDAFGEYSRCIWIGLHRAVEKEAITHRLAGFHYNSGATIHDLEEVVNTAAGVNNISDLFDLNDRQSLDGGPVWAVDTLEKAARLIIAPANSSAVVPDSSETEKPASGFTSNVVSRVKQWLKR